MFISSQNTLLVYKYFNEEAVKYAKIIAHHLLSNSFCTTVFVENVNSFSELKCYEKFIVAFNSNLHGNLINLVIVLGGDGTTLWANSLFNNIEKPKFLTLNLGNVGYLSYYNCEQYEKVFYELFCREDKSISLENRSTLNVSFISEDPNLKEITINCLNDIVFDKGQSTHMIKSKIFINDEFFTTIRSDGLLISTSTGSTAYNLSCAGSIIHSDVDSMILNAISPFSLSFRPIIFTRGTEITLTLDEQCKFAQVGNDGIKTYLIKGGEGIKVSISDKDLTLIVLENIISNPINNWMDRLVNQLGWNTAFQNP